MLMTIAGWAVVSFSNLVEQMSLDANLEMRLVDPQSPRQKDARRVHSLSRHAAPKESMCIAPNQTHVSISIRNLLHNHFVHE